jgi:hypothetical protein
MLRAPENFESPRGLEFHMFVSFLFFAAIICIATSIVYDLPLAAYVSGLLSYALLLFAEVMGSRRSLRPALMLTSSTEKIKALVSVFICTLLMFGATTLVLKKENLFECFSFMAIAAPFFLSIIARVRRSAQD